MKVWKMRDLGLQATTSILGHKDPLSRLKELAEDFPSHANKLSTIKVRYDSGNVT